MVIYKIKKTNFSYNKHFNGYLLQQKLEKVNTWSLVCVGNFLIMANHAEKNREKVQRTQAIMEARQEIEGHHLLAWN